MRGHRTCRPKCPGPVGPGPKNPGPKNPGQRTRDKGVEGDRTRRRGPALVEQAAIEARVPLPAFGIEDLDLDPATWRPEPIPGDGHLGSLADDVPSESNPGPPR